MDDTVMLVTGSTDGIGRQTAIELARRGASVLVHGRSPKKVQESVAEVQQEARHVRVKGFVADLSHREEVERLAREVSGTVGRLDVLVHNAGVFMRSRSLTPDGVELTFAVNHLAPFLLTHRLLPLLERSAPARVVVVSSIAHTRGKLDVEDLSASRGYDAYTAYASSKLANVLFTLELAERLQDRGVTANCLHPGVVTTKLLKEGFGASGASVEEGARACVHVATAQELKGVSGRYFAQGQEATVAPAAMDVGLRRRLWHASERLAGLA
ncbi:MAG: SDR family oxidoreductase [Myxococcaceae bacterium]|nr:SDR family oxidoreductase [Myxococcaceae bacterium]MCI0672157.1 SDR family oxidoreductase [Myxococcaceae bacterium]